MRFNFPFPLKEEEQFSRDMLDKSVSRFTWKHKLFYSALRPVLPAGVRHLVNRLYNSNVSYRESFIDDTLICQLKEDCGDIGEVCRLYPPGYTCAIIHTHDVESGEGLKYIPKVIELEEKYKVRSSWNIVPYKYKIDPGIIRLIREAGHEIGIHGYNHDGRLYSSRKIFESRIPFINHALDFYGAAGFRSPMVHRNLEWQQKLNIKYDSSCFDYDPFQPFPDSIGIIWPFRAGHFIELPYTLPQDHMLFNVLKHKNIDCWKSKSRWLAENNGMILSLTHPDYMLDKAVFQRYEEFLIHLEGFTTAWRCLPGKMADQFIAREREMDTGAVI